MSSAFNLQLLPHYILIVRWDGLQPIATLSFKIFDDIFKFKLIVFFGIGGHINGSLVSIELKLINAAV